MSRPNYSRLSINNIVNTIERAKSVRSIEQMFFEDLCLSIELDSKKNTHVPSKTFKPSGMNCKRMSFYTVIGISPEAENRSYSSIGITESGTDRHDRIQKAIEGMRANGFDCDYYDVETYINQHGLQDDLEVVQKCGMETKVYCKRLNMSFLTDGIIKYRNIYYIFEFKTEISNKWYSRTGIDPIHISQGTAYSEAFKIPDVLFLYENRNTCEKKPYMLHVTDEMRNCRIVDYVADVNSYIENKKVPPMPTDPEILKKCKYCVYSAICASHGLSSKIIDI